MRLSNREHQITTFDEVLSLVKVKIPLLIEFMDQPYKNFIKTAVEKLKNYKGDFAVQSFNPLIIKEIKKLAPEFVRGILATGTHAKKYSSFKCWVLKNMPLNFLIKPDFISYSFEDLPLKKSKTKNIPVITWTVTDKTTAENVKPFAKNIIFERFIP